MTDICLKYQKNKLHKHSRILQQIIDDNDIILTKPDENGEYFVFCGELIKDRIFYNHIEWEVEMCQ